jgi:hypothetical protein
MRNQERRNRNCRANARKYNRCNKASRDNKNCNSGSQIDNLYKANERDCMIDACDSAKIARRDKRNNRCYANKQNSRENARKTCHNLEASARRKNEHLNMNKKERDNLHSHKRVVTEFDKLEHFKKCSENCKDAEKGRRARVNKANNCDKNQRRRKGHRIYQTRNKDSNKVCQQRDKDESNYCKRNNKNSNRKYLKNKDVCNSDNNNIYASADAASCANDERRANSNSCNDENVCKCKKNNSLVDYDANCRNRNSRDRYNKCASDRQSRYPAGGPGCNGGRCNNGYNGGRCDDGCGDDFY